MKDEFDELISISETHEYEFKEICGLTFAFKTTIVTFNDTIASCDIKPQGIIYRENDDFYFAPLDRVDDIKAIIKSFVENYTSK